MKKIKILSLLVIVLMSATVLYGCGAPKGNVVSVILDSSAVLIGYDDIEDAIYEQEKGLENGRIKNTYQNRMLLENTKILRDWSKEKGINISSKSWGWGDTLTQKLLAAFFTQETPDVIMGETQMPGFARQNYLEAFPDTLAAWIRENVSPIAYEAMEIDGKIYGISITPGISLLVWNKALLRTAGIDRRIIESGPADWAEWESVMSTLYSNNINAGGTYVGNGGVNYGAFFRAGTMMAAAGGGFADAAGAPDMQTAANEKALSFIRRQANYNQLNMLNAKEESSYFNYFNTGKMAYKIDGIWSLYEASTYNIDIGYCMLPAPEKTGDPASLLIGVGYMAVPVYAKNKDLAWETLEFMLREDIQANIGKGGNRPPVLKSVIDTVYNDTSADYYKPYMADYKKYAQYAAENSVSGLPAFYMKNGKISDLWAAAGNCLAYTVDKKNTDEISDLLKNAQNIMIKEWKKG